MSLEDLTEIQQSFADSVKESGIPITESALKDKFEAMAGEEGITFKNPGQNSAWWCWLSAIAVAPVLWLIEYLVKEVLPNLYVKTASGAFLDLHGYRMGVDRKRKTKTQGYIQFSRLSTGVSLTIPAGTVIQTAPINGTVYRVISQVDGVFSAGDSVISVLVEAENPGVAYNLAANYFVILPVPITGITGVTNAADWITVPGSDDEEDDAYRQRIRGHFSAISNFHINSVYKTLISEFSSIDYDRIFIDQTTAPRGAGSADAFILFDAGVPSTQFIDEINDYIIDQGFHGLGDDFQVKPLPETLHDMTANVWVAKNTTSEVKDALQAEVNQFVRCAFRENTDFTCTKTWPNSRFSMGRLTSEIIRRFDGIESIEWTNGDIVSVWDIPRIETLTVNIVEVAA